MGNTHSSTTQSGVHPEHGQAGNTQSPKIKHAHHTQQQHQNQHQQASLKDEPQQQKKPDSRELQQTHTIISNENASRTAATRLRGMTTSSMDSTSPIPSPVVGMQGQSQSLESASPPDDIRKGEESSRSSSTQELLASPMDMPNAKRGSISSNMEETEEPYFETEPTGNTVPTFINWPSGGDKVYVTGTFTGWRRKIPLVKSRSDFSTILHLPAGTHRLKFLVDNEWRCSDDLAQATDSVGNLVNYIEITSEDNLPSLERADKHGDLSDWMQRPQEVWTKRVPSFLIDAVERSSSHASPPSLPPHLEKVILNANSTMKDDSSVLPNPNHVVLNHLSASSIRNNVLAVSATTRYRRKYVSTILYKALDLN